MIKQLMVCDRCSTEMPLMEEARFGVKPYVGVNGFNVCNACAKKTTLWDIIEKVCIPLAEKLKAEKAAKKKVTA